MSLKYEPASEPLQISAKDLHADVGDFEGALEAVMRIYIEPTDSTKQGGVPREQKMLKGHLPRVIYHQVY